MILLLPFLHSELLILWASLLLISAVLSLSLRSEDQNRTGPGGIAARLLSLFLLAQSLLGSAWESSGLHFFCRFFHRSCSFSSFFLRSGCLGKVQNSTGRLVLDLMVMKPSGSEPISEITAGLHHLSGSITVWKLWPLLLYQGGSHSGSLMIFRLTIMMMKLV